MTDANITRYILFSILGMLIIGILVIWFLNRAQNKISNEKIKTQEQKLEFRKELLENTVRTQENERERISKELHDDVTSQLSIIHLNLHMLKNKVDNEGEVATLIDHIESSLKNSTERTRSIAHELMPAIFKKFGFHHALKELANSVNLTNHVELKANNEHLLTITNQFKLLHIYRILQELINNSLKYAQASHLIIEFSNLENNFIQLTYIDDGVGFNTKQQSEGLGMSNLKTRIELLNGEILVDSSPGHGTNVTCKFPNYD